MNLDAVVGGEPYEAAPSYDELFPSLPENDGTQEGQAPGPSSHLGQWTQRMKLKSSIITQVFQVPVEERKFRDLSSQRFGEQGGEQGKVCADIMHLTGAHIEVSSSKDQSLTILVTGKEEAVLKARRHILKELQTQASKSISIPKEHHRFILGKNGKKLAELENRTATKISVPRPDEKSDSIKITGTREGIENAVHEIQVASDKQAKVGFEQLDIPKVYHPFICGPFNETVSLIAAETGARINIPPPTVYKDELSISGEKEAVAQAKEKVLAIYEERKRNCQQVSVEVPKNQHKYVIGPRGQTLQEILQETGVSVEMPKPDVQSDTITLRGPQASLGPALTLVYSKANSVVKEVVEAPSWLHKYIIGKKGANIKLLTQDLTKVQVDFADGHDSIRVEGPPEEVKEACRKLREMTTDLRKQVAYEELKVKPEFHRHIIGKNGANINRLKEESKALIHVPSDESDVIRIEGDPQGVQQVKRLLQEMVHKMENEVSKELLMEHRFHRNIIGAKGEKIREIRDKFNQVNVTFPESGLKSNKVILRGPKADVEACAKHLLQLHEELRINNFFIDVPIYKQNHKFIIGKGGANIKKIRDETSTRIDLPAEGAESDVITIRGRKEDVLQARDKILAIQEELDNIVTQEIIIPSRLHNSLIGSKGRLIRSITEECGGVTVKFPREGTGSDKVSIRGPEEDVVKAKKLLLDLSNEKQLMSYTAEVKAQPDQHKFLIGKNGVNIKKVRERTGARIVFPNENDEDRETITIIGRKEEVEKAKKELEDMIQDLKETKDIEMEVDPKHHRHFVARRGEVLKQIGDEFGGVAVSFPRNGSQSSTVKLSGSKDFVELARQRILEIVDDLEAMVTVECVIPQEHHRTVLGSRGAKVQNVQKQFNVSIKFPDREKPPQNDSEKPTMNGDCNLAPESENDQQKNTIIIHGRPENCELAKQALLDLVPVTEEMEVPYDMHRFIIGQKGRDVRQLMDEHDVNIGIPRAGEQSDTITLKGVPASVRSARAALEERIRQLELEKQDRLLRSFQLSVEVDPVHHPKIIGRGGAVISKIRKEHNVNVNFPDRAEGEGGEERIITITGYEKDALAAKEAILRLVQEQEDLFKEEVMLDSRVHSRIIGSRGRNVVKIMDMFKVDIRFPRSTDPEPDLVVIQGKEEDVLDAKDHLLNLEEEYVQDLKERDLMRQYTLPPSRNGHVEGGRGANSTDDRGFVVKGAPWDRAPDTSDQTEFPSFGGPGPAHQHAVAWGPRR